MRRDWLYHFREFRGAYAAASMFVLIFAVYIAKHLRDRRLVLQIELDHLAAVAQKPLVRRRRFHHAAARREIASKDSGRAVTRDGIGQRMDDVALVRGVAA